MSVVSELSLEKDSVPVAGTAPGRRTGGSLTAEQRIMMYEAIQVTAKSPGSPQAPPSLGNTVNRRHLAAHILNAE